MPVMVTTGDFKNTGKEQLTLFGGSNFYIPSGTFRNIKIAIEAGLPVYQYVNGMQMDQELIFIAGVQYSFSTN
jgi:hypothetical protein